MVSTFTWIYKSQMKINFLEKAHEPPDIKMRVDLS